MTTIQAIFRDGAFWPIEPVELPESTRVELSPRLVTEASKVPSLEDVYDLLKRRFHSGEGDIAERHNEHQP